MSFILGIDPGVHGAMSLVDLSAKTRTVYCFAKFTPHDIADILKFTKDDMCEKIDAYIEEVHSMPNNGKVQAFSFGKNYGFWLGLLTGLGIPYNNIMPIVWQTALRLRVRKLEYKQKKKALKEHAQRLFPELNPTLDSCDALLIAEYGRQLKLKENRLAK